MILIADSGSTKTHWAIAQNNILEFKETEGLNPFFVDEHKISNVVSELTAKQIHEIYFYGAGCASNEKKEVVRNGLKKKFKEADIYVESDLLGAARAVYADDTGWISILGTGSNTAFYDGNKLIKYTPSLGYILGDEGSGAYLGKIFLKKIFYKQINSSVIEAFYNQFGDDIHKILSDVYMKPFPNRYLAQYSKFIYQHKHYDEVQAIVLESFDELLKQHVLPYYKTNVPVSFVGSIAFYFQDELKILAQKNQICLYKIIQNPIDGLVEYHCKSKCC